MHRSGSGRQSSDDETLMADVVTTALAFPSPLGPVPRGINDFNDTATILNPVQSAETGNDSGRSVWLGNLSCGSFSRSEARASSSSSQVLEPTT